MDMILEPSLEVKIDSNRMARVQFTSPLAMGGIRLRLASNRNHRAHGLGRDGPRKWRRGSKIRSLETPHTTLIGEANRTIRAWSTDKPLMPGKYMIDGCFILTDQDPSNTCHSVGMLRFEVFEEREPLGKLLGYGDSPNVNRSLDNLLHQGSHTPTAFLCGYSYACPLSTWSCCQPTRYRLLKANEGRGAAPSFILLSHDGGLGAVSLDDLLDGSDAVVVGLFQSDLLMQNIREMILNLLTS